MSAPVPQTTASLYTLRKRILTHLALAIAAAAQRLHAITAGQSETTPADLRAALALIKLAPKILSELPSDPDQDEDADHEALPHSAESADPAASVSTPHLADKVPPVSPPAETIGVPAQTPKPPPPTISANPSNPKPRISRPKSPISNLESEITSTKSEISNLKSEIPTPKPQPNSSPAPDPGPRTTDLRLPGPKLPPGRCTRCGLAHGTAPCPDPWDPRAVAIAARAEALHRAATGRH